MADYIYKKSNGKPTNVEKLTTTFKQNGKIESTREILKFLKGFKDTDDLMDWVNEKIQISNEHYKGTYASLALLEAVQGADDEDFGNVIAVDAHGNTVFQRYKYINGSWVYQYDTTNPEFSDEEWDAIKSGITAALVEKLENLARVAETGDYSDLQNKPTIPAAQIQSDWNQTDNTQKDYIKNKPTIHTIGGYTQDEVGKIVMIMGVARMSGAASISVSANPEWLIVMTDGDNKILLGIKSDYTWGVFEDFDTIIDCVIDSYNNP